MRSIDEIHAALYHPDIGTTDMDGQPFYDAIETAKKALAQIQSVFSMLSQAVASAEGEDLGTIYELDLSTRSMRALERIDVFTLQQLVQLTPRTLMGIKNFGVGSLKEVQKALERHGLQLRTSPMTEMR